MRDSRLRDPSAGIDTPDPRSGGDEEQRKRSNARTFFVFWNSAGDVPRHSWDKSNRRRTRRRRYRLRV